MNREDSPLPANDHPSQDPGQAHESHGTGTAPESPEAAPRTYRRLLPELITVSRAFQTKRRPKTDTQEK